MNDVQKNEVMPVVDDSVITEYLDSSGLTKSLLPKEKAMFINMCRGYGLNPFKREIYCTAYGEGQYRKCSIVTGFEVYLKRAERTGKLNGWHVTSSGSADKGDLTATITIRRKDWAEPFVHTVMYKECVQTTKDGKPNSVWAKQPSYMTKKVAMGQGFRLCFPDELGGMPYTSDEMGDETPYMVQAEKPEPVEVKRNVIAPNECKNEPSDAYIALEQLLTEHGMDLRLKNAKVQPYTMAKQCLDNPDSKDSDFVAMRDRCLDFLKRKGVQIA